MPVTATKLIVTRVLTRFLVSSLVSYLRVVYSLHASQTATLHHFTLPSPRSQNLIEYLHRCPMESLFNSLSLSFLFLPSRFHHSLSPTLSLSLSLLLSHSLRWSDSSIESVLSQFLIVFGFSQSVAWNKNHRQEYFDIKSVDGRLLDIRSFWNWFCH